MKAYCTNCEEIQPASFRPECSEKGDYEDLCCDECHMILATVEERDVGVGQRMVAIFYKDSDGSRWLYSLDADPSISAPSDGDVIIGKAVVYVPYKESENETSAN